MNIRLITVTCALGIVLALTVTSVFAYEPIRGGPMQPVSYCQFPGTTDVIKVAGSFCPSGSTKIGSAME